MGSQHYDERSVGKQATAASPPERAIIALLYLMSRFPARQTNTIACAVKSQLQILQQDIRVSEELRFCAEKLLKEWDGYAVLTESSPEDCPSQHLN